MYYSKCLRYFIVALLPFSGMAQTIVSQSSGNWDDPATWSGGIVPSSLNSSAVHILTGHTVTLRTTLAIDGLQVSSGGSLIISSSGNLQLSDGAGTDLTISGIVDVNGTIEG